MRNKSALVLAVGLSLAGWFTLAGKNSANNPETTAPNGEHSSPAHVPEQEPDPGAPARAPVEGDLIPPLAPEFEGDDALGFYQAPLADVIRFLGEHAEEELGLAPGDFSGPVLQDDRGPFPPVTLTLTNVTAREALGSILEQYDLALEEEPGTGKFRVVEVAAASEPAAESNGAAVVEPGHEVVPLLMIGEMPLLEVITLLADSAKLDIMFDPRILPGGEMEVSANPLPMMRFHDRTSHQVLEAVLQNHDLVMIPDSRSGIARISRRPPPDAEPLVTEVIQLRYSNVTNIASIVQGVLSQRSRVSMDPRTSQLVLVTTEGELEGVGNLIAQLDTPTKQVLIESRLLETSHNPRSIRGIDWSGTFEAQNITFGNGFTTGTTETRSPGDPVTRTLPSGRQVTSSPGHSERTDLTTLVGRGGLSLDTARGLHPTTAFLNADGVRAVLSFLNTEADTRVLATPRAVTVDNETATLEVTRAFPIFEVTPGAAQVPAGAQITYTNLGTILKVTPRITADSNVFLRVVPEVSNIDSVDRQIINGLENTANIYAIRKIETHVTIPSGNTLVMGGLISDSTAKSYTKVPILGDIPGLGLLFRRDSKMRSQANLLIFVTPTIIRENHFHPTETEFLNQQPGGDELEPEFSAIDRGKPRSWRNNN